MSEYNVKLEVFEGPLDLLLYLIKKQDMDIMNVKISDITQEYLTYIQLMKDLSLETAGEFLVMASTLLQIKARMLLPSEAGAPEDEGPDPRTELIARLLEYQKFKEAAKVLAQREFDAREVYYRNVPPIFAEEDMNLDSTLFDLLDAFKKVLHDAGDDIKELLYEQIPLEQKIREILDLLEQKDCIHFNQIFSADKPRRELIVSFLALLELIRLKQIVARQSAAFGEIWIYRIPEDKSAPANPYAGPAAGPEGN